jgi:hypothetical protein
MHTLQTLQIFGLDPVSEAARRAIARVAEHGRWEHAGQQYFDGELEPCINGRTIETGAYFGLDVTAIVGTGYCRLRERGRPPHIRRSAAAQPLGSTRADGHVRRATRSRSALPA